MDVLTKGDVIVNKLEIGDITYEYEYGHGIKSKVISKPIRSEEGYWTWQSIVEGSGRIINYGVNENYPAYGLNLYTYPAYLTNNLEE